MDFNDLIGLEVCEAESKLLQSGITNFKFVYYVDRKQKQFDREIVTAVRQLSDEVQLIVCRYLFETE